MTLPRAGSRSVSDRSTGSLADALNALCAELGIPLPEMLRTVEDALAMAYVRAFSPPGMVTVKLDTASGGLDVTSRVRDASGNETVVVLPAEEFKRMAAQTAKHAVLRHIHDLERDKVLREVSEHRGELATGVVDRIEAGTVYVDLGRAEGVMPTEEQIPGEQLHPGRPVLVVILDPQRNRAILSELASEHVDIVPWSEDSEAFVAAALGPAKVESVSIDRSTRTATVMVPRTQLSLAIGRDGQNARLAAKLTGFRIDIKPSDSEPLPDAEEPA